VGKPRTIYESRFYDFALDHDHNALWFQWKPETASLDDDAFKEGLSNYAGYAIEYRPRHLVVDVRQFHGNVSAETVGSWRDRVIIPRYNKAEISKMATLAAPGSGPPPSPPDRYDGQSFQSATFDSEESLNAWLTE